MEHVGKEEQQHLLHQLQLEHGPGAGLSVGHKICEMKPSGVRAIYALIKPENQVKCWLHL